MKADYKPCFRVNNKPDIILFTVNLSNSFISMLLIRVKINGVLSLAAVLCNRGANILAQEAMVHGKP